MLFVITFVVCAITVMSVRDRHQQSVLEQREGALVFAELARKVSAIASMDIARADQRFTLERKSTGWANNGIGGFPALRRRIESVIGELAGLTYVAPKTSRSNRYHKLQVEDVAANAQSTRVTIKDAGGLVLADLIVGKAKANVAGLDRRGVYVRLPGQARAWLMEGSLDVHYGAADWSDNQLVDVKAGSIESMKVVHADGQRIELVRNQAVGGNSRSPLTIKELPDNTRIENQYQIDYIAGLLDGISFLNAKPAGDLSMQTDIGTRAEVVTTKGLVVALHAAAPEKDGTVWVRIAASVKPAPKIDEEVSAQVAVVQSKFADWAIRLPRTIADRLRIRLQDIIASGGNQ